MNKINSVGNFSSSQIYRLMGSAKVAQTYIDEKNLERRFLRKINNEQDSKPTSWGKMMEGYAFDKLPVQYKLCSKDTLVHPEYPFWVGTPDILTHDTVGDIKNPFTLKSFYGLSTVCSGENLLAYSEDYFWQLVSNSILTDKQYCELIVHAPYEDEFNAIMEYYNDYENKPEIIWFGNTKPESLPLIKRASRMKDLYIIRFEPDNTLKEQLTNAVIKASEKLISL